MKKLLFDAGKDWESLTTFSPIRNQPKFSKVLKKKSSIIQSKGYAELNIFTGYRLLSAFSHLRYNNQYYVYLHPTFIIDKNQTEYHYEGNFQPLNNKESSSGIGFENDWVVLQIGKGILKNFIRSLLVV